MTPETRGEITVVCPEARNYLSGFPSYDDKEAFFNDSLLYRRFYAFRDTERGAQAVQDASTDISFYLQRFGKAMNVNLSETGTPMIAKYIKTTHQFARSGVSTAKEKFSRQRPYSYFKEASLIPSDEGTVGEFASYPSGHTVRAWAITLALVAIDDEHCSDIVKVGMEIGESRLIAGFHYASDVEGAKLAASVAFAKIVSDPEYIYLLEEARRELESIR